MWKLTLYDLNYILYTYLVIFAFFLILSNSLNSSALVDTHSSLDAHAAIVSTTTTTTTARENEEYLQVPHPLLLLHHRHRLGRVWSDRTGDNDAHTVLCTMCSLSLTSLIGVRVYTCVCAFMSMYMFLCACVWVCVCVCVCVFVCRPSQ